jgi:NADH-quinone oxidoreductase subunit L
MLIATVAIAGLPPFSGFFSKDEILAAAFFKGRYVIYALGLLGAALTAFYMTRLVVLTFFGASRVDPDVAPHVHESPPVMTGPLWILAVLAAGAGVWGIPWGEAGNWIGHFLAPVLGREAPHHGAAVYALMAVSVLAALGGIAVAGWMYAGGRADLAKVGVPQNAVHRVLLNKYYVDELYDAAIVQPLARLCRWCATVVDQRWIDGLVNGVGAVCLQAAGSLRRLQTGFVMNYALSMLIGVAALLGLLLWR